MFPVFHGLALAKLHYADSCLLSLMIRSVVLSRFSICVSSYKDAEYLPACIDSVLHQSFVDFELVIVDDGSPDNTASILKDYAERDGRVKPIIKSHNEGVHLGRKSAVEQCSGDLIILLDSDDELEPGFLSELNDYSLAHPADIYHFGIKVVNAGVSEQERIEFESYVNRDIEPLNGSDICNAAFSSEAGYRQDWRITQRAYDARYFKRVFSDMTNDRMGRAQDGYECFVALAEADSQLTCNDIVGLKYYLGRGVNSGSKMSPDSFLRSAQGFWSSVTHMADFSENFNKFDLSMAFSGGKTKLMDLLFNDWFVRVDNSNKIDAAKKAASVVGDLEAAEQVLRLTRDAAYAEWVNDGGDVSVETLRTWYREAKSMAGTDYFVSNRLMDFADAAKLHICEVEERAKKRCCAKQDIRIFVSTHKRVDLFDSELFQPVQVGCSSRSDIFRWAFQDNDGENISDQNPMYCELTTQYWAWKNTDSDYVGFCHYRRYFDFARKRHEENLYGEVMDAYIDAKSQAEYCLDDDSVRKYVKEFDVITTERKDIRPYCGSTATIRKQYDLADKLFVEDLDKVVSILGKQHPEYLQDAQTFLKGHTARFCNMFIMKRDIFNAYCEWLFPILEEFVNTTDMSKYSKEGLRTPGHLAERLLNIYLLHHERVGAAWKTAELQCVHFTEPDYHGELGLPRLSDDPRPIIPVVFASDNNYVPMLTTTIYSMLVNASTDYRYDIVVLHRDINGENQARMKSFFGAFPHADLRFCSVSAIIDQYELTTNNPHISVETYYRFLIQKLLPYYNKVLYLDSDLIVKGDISELYEIELGTNLLGATRDIDFLGNLNMKNGDRLKYAKEVLGMNDPYDYFQAGVLLLNTYEMRNLHTIEEWLEFASDDRFIYNDQDVLNAHCEGRVTWLNYDWNVMIDCGNRIANVFSYAPHEVFDAFNDSRGHERIVHYAGFEKPWKFAYCDRSQLYWKYARETPFYEKLLALLMGSVASVDTPLLMHEKAISETSPLRKIVDPLCPVGSARREVLKSIGRAVQGKK